MEKAEIFKFIPSGFSFEEVDGYNKLPPIVIGKYFEHARGVGTDLYVVKHFTSTSSTILAKGYVPTGDVGNAAELMSKQKALISMLDKERNSAISQIKNPSDVYQTRDGQFSVVFVPCKDGFIGCGWYDHVGTKRKGLKLAAFVLYAYGIINVKIDPELWEVTYKYLPYDSELGRADFADNVIFSTLKDEVIARNNAAPKIIRITDGTGN